jgi:hypothetical protein
MKKKLSETQWADVMRRYLVDGIGSRALAEEYGIPESTIRKRAKSAQYAQVETVANQLVSANNNLKNMEKNAQVLVCALAQKLTNISNLTADVTEMEAKSAKQLSAIKAAQILDLDPQAIDRETLMNIKVLGDCVNDSLRPALSVMNTMRASDKKSGTALAAMSEEDYLRAINDADRRMNRK